MGTLKTHPSTCQESLLASPEQVIVTGKLAKTDHLIHLGIRKEVDRECLKDKYPKFPSENKITEYNTS